MDKETYSRLLLEKSFSLTDSGVARAKLQVSGTGPDDNRAVLLLEGSYNNGARIFLENHVAVKFAPAFGESLVVEVRRATDEEKEAEKIRLAVDVLKEIVSTKNVASGGRYFSAHPDLWAHRELLEELLSRELGGFSSRQIPEFFESVQVLLQEQK